MDHTHGAGSEGAARINFDRRARLESQGTQLVSDGGLLVMRELYVVLALTDLASSALCDSRRGKNDPPARRSVFRLGTYCIYTAPSTQARSGACRMWRRPWCGCSCSTSTTMPNLTGKRQRRCSRVSSPRQRRKSN